MRPESFGLKATHASEKKNYHRAAIFWVAVKELSLRDLVLVTILGKPYQLQYTPIMVTCFKFLHRNP